MNTPKLSIENGNIRLGVVVQTNLGFGTLRGMVCFVDYCKKYGREIFIMKPGKEGRGNCKSIMESLLFVTPRGEKLEFVVEGDDAEARKTALGIYSALTSEDSYNMDFHRFE